MSETGIWFSIGMEHILSLEGYDHILFVSLLAVSFPPTEWKKLLGLITAFTLGHSLSLALGALDIIRVKQSITEPLIALTILLSALRLYFAGENHPNRVKAFYLIICCFGWIHGMGFSYALNTLLPAGDSLLKPLLLFNLGLEAGQVIVVALVLIPLIILLQQPRISFTLIQKTIAVLSGVLALYLCVERLSTPAS